MPWIPTHSGKKLDLIDPQPDQINLIDIIKGLSRESRYVGQTNHFYTVAQHSMIASQIVAPEFAFEALLHDGAEAYLKDLPRPLKYMLPDYRRIEQRVDAAIRARFGLPAEQSNAVSEADIIMRATERRDLIINDPTDWPCLEGIKPLEKRLIAINHHRAESAFMQRLIEVIQQ